jgi:hypothetical protein
MIEGKVVVELVFDTLWDRICQPWNLKMIEGKVVVELVFDTLWDRICQPWITIFAFRKARCSYSPRQERSVCLCVCVMSCV